MASNPPINLKPWASEPFRSVVAYLRETAAFADAVTFGLANTGKIALAEELFQELDRLLTTDPMAVSPQRADILKDLRERAKHAEEQVRSGLPLLYSQFAVGTWSVLEAAIDDFVIAWLVNVPQAITSEDFAKIKVSIAVYEQLDPTSRMQLLLEEYKRNLRSELKIGVERFESLLKPLGLIGPLADDVRRDILELSQVRNVILHRSGRVDQKLLSGCPWLNLKPGEKLAVTQQDSDRYVHACTEYLKQIISRVKASAEAVSEVAGAI